MIFDPQPGRTINGATFRPAEYRAGQGDGDQQRDKDRRRAVQSRNMAAQSDESARQPGAGEGEHIENHEKGVMPTEIRGTQLGCEADENEKMQQE